MARGLTLVLVSATLLVLCATPALAAETIGSADPHATSGEGCPAGQTYVQKSGSSADYSIPTDGVITSWSLDGGWGGSAAFKIARPGAAGSYTIVASDGPRALVAGTDSFPVRIPVRQGDTLALYLQSAHTCFGSDGDPGDVYESVASNPPPGETIHPSSPEASSRIPVSAQFEADLDGDGYGDETQDQCPTDGATHDACPLPTVLGQTFSPHWPTCTDSTVMPLTTPAVISSVQRDGVITSWSYESIAMSGTVKLEVLQPLGGSVYLAKAADAPHLVSSAGLNTFPVRIPVRAGDRIAIAAGGIPVCGIRSSAWLAGTRGADLGVGSSGTFGSETGLAVDLSAVEEADGDGDGYGDTSQDACPASAATTGACPSAGPPPAPPAKKQAKAKKACDKARAKLTGARSKLKKLRRDEASAKRIAAAKKSVGVAKKGAKKACSAT